MLNVLIIFGAFTMELMIIELTSDIEFSNYTSYPEWFRDALSNRIIYSRYNFTPVNRLGLGCLEWYVSDGTSVGRRGDFIVNTSHGIGILTGMAVLEEVLIF